MKQLHKYQLKILLRLLHNKSLHYLKLKPDPTMENNSLQFHLNQLIKRKLVTKNENGYILTSKGKDYANRLDTKRVKLETQAKISAVVCCYKNTGAERELLVYTRKKHPFYDHQGFLSGKVTLGESITEAAERELKEETSLSGKAELCFILHLRNYSKVSKKLLQDVFMFFTRVINPKGEVIPNDEGVFEWVKQSELKEKIKNPFESMDHIMQIVDKTTNFNGVIDFQEVTSYTSEF